MTRVAILAAFALAAAAGSAGAETKARRADSGPCAAASAKPDYGRLLQIPAPAGIEMLSKVVLLLVLLWWYRRMFGRVTSVPKASVPHLNE